MSLTVEGADKDVFHIAGRSVFGLREVNIRIQNSACIRMASIDILSPPKHVACIVNLEHAIDLAGFLTGSLAGGADTVCAKGMSIDYRCVCVAQNEFRTFLSRNAIAIELAVCVKFLD